MITARVRECFGFSDDASETERIHATGLSLAYAAFLGHYALFSWWYIEDASISFAFARNAARGLGFVAFSGGERVEGFSNPAWTLLLTAADFIGINPFIAAKAFGAIFGLITLRLAWRWARQLASPDALTPLIAPIFLSLSPHFVLWCASGLENSLFMVLLASGVVVQLREVERRRYLGSGFLWTLLAITRPEAPMYAAIGGAGGFLLAVVRQGLPWALGWAIAWGLSFTLPFGAWHAWRFNYFAFPFPNTYYAKLAEAGKFQPWNWDARGWTYLRQYAWTSGMGPLFPLFALGQSGFRQRGTVLALALTAATALFVAPELDVFAGVSWPAFTRSGAWSQARVLIIGADLALLPLLGVGRRGAGERMLAWYLCSTALFFALYSGGDWMKVHRWLSMAIVPLATMFADAIHGFFPWVEHYLGAKRFGVAVKRTTVAVPIVLGLVITGDFILNPETSPYDVHRRVKYMQRVADRLGLEHPRLLDVDMGAHLWWSGFEIIDLAGLVDVPMGHHKWQIPFVEEYVYQESKPDFAHVHGSWGGTRTNITRHAAWAQYLEIDPFPVSRLSAHPGNHVRRDLFIHDRWSGSAKRSATFDNGGELVGLDFVASDIAADTLWVEVGWRAAKKTKDFRALLFLSGQARIFAAELPPGYDWYPPSRWAETEVVTGQHRISLPSELPPGAYDVGIALLPAGQRTEPISSVQPTLPARFSQGEVRWAAAVTILPLAEAQRRSDIDLGEALRLADRGDCDSSAATLRRARARFSRHAPWTTQARAAWAPRQARCLALRANTKNAADDAAAARQLAPTDPAIAARLNALANRWEAEGDRANIAGRPLEAHQAWTRALLADPRRSTLRARVEELRDRRLRIDPNATDEADGTRGDGDR